MKFTVFTPTYNRAHSLPRVYESLKKQTNLNFIWLIIDDGSIDGTQELVQKWKVEGILDIQYFYKENQGKHTAMARAYQTAHTQYFISLDSDDELLPDALDTFEKEWTNLELQGLQDEFAEISAMTRQTDGSLVGNFHFSKEISFLDSYWQEMVLKFHNHNEHISCWNFEKLVELASIPEKFWLSDKVSYVSEFVLWARLGKKYKTRYLNKSLRIYHVDSNNSLLRNQLEERTHYNLAVSIKYFLDENLSYFFWNPSYFIRLAIKFIISGFALNLKASQILKEIKTWGVKFLYVSLLPIGYFGNLYFKYYRKQYWFYNSNPITEDKF
jgi:glycosyltransferase involved in cell wall biosynthesis